MNKLSKRIENLPASATLAMAAKARELKNKGVDVISLSLGEPDFNTPDFIKQAAIRAIEENYHSYPPVDGYLELKKAICEKFKRDNSLNYEPSQIIVSTGAKQSIANVCMALLNKGDEVLLPAPYWVSYSAIVTLSEAKFKIIPTSMENGSVYVLSDEIYEHIIYGEKHFSFANLPNMFDRTITVNGLAKAFSMTGWRIGYIGAPEFIAKACNKFQGQITSAANCIAQRSAITALKAPISDIKYMIDEFNSRKELIFGLMSKIPGFKLLKPSGAFYLFPDISFYFGKEINGKIVNDANDFAMTILEEANVATVSGDSFGNKNCLRISYAASKEEIIEAVSRIKNLLADN